MRDYLRVILAMIELEFRRLMHDRNEIYLRAAQPIIWLLLFGHVIGALRAIPTGSTPYIDYIMPGVLVQAATSVAIFFGLLIIWERESGILKKLVASPAPQPAIVVGRSFAGGVRALFQSVFIIPLAILLGVTVILNPIYLLLALIVVFFSAGGFAGLSIMIAAILKSRERFMGLGQVIILPLFFASSALYPISSMPPLLQSFASINPMTYMVDALRGLLITGDLSQLPLDLGAIALFDIVIFTLASLTFRKIVE